MRWRAYQRAEASGTQMRLVTASAVVRRVLSLSGVDRLVPVYPSLDAAVAARAPVPARSVVARAGEGAGRGNYWPPRTTSGGTDAHGFGLPACRAALMHPARDLWPWLVTGLGMSPWAAGIMPGGPGYRYGPGSGTYGEN
jgi:hypothetical protein